MLWTLCTCEWLSLNNLDADFMAQLGIRHCRDTVRVNVFLTTTGETLVVCCLIMFASTVLFLFNFCIIFLFFRRKSQDKHFCGFIVQSVNTFTVYTLKNLS